MPPLSWLRIFRVARIFHSSKHATVPPQHWRRLSLSLTPTLTLTLTLIRLPLTPARALQLPYTGATPTPGGAHRGAHPLRHPNPNPNPNPNQAVRTAGRILYVNREILLVALTLVTFMVFATSNP